MNIKNWGKFQHFKDRSPPWIKLHRSVLEDRQWHDLDPRAAKTLVMLWLIASEHNGELPSIEDLAWRLRVSDKLIAEDVIKLSHWLEQVDINAISERYHLDITCDTADDAGEKRRGEERQRERREEERAFSEFWNVCPRKVRKEAARKAFARASKRADPERIISGMTLAANAWKQNGTEQQFIPHPATWLNDGGWEDEIPKQTPRPDDDDKSPSLWCIS